MEKDFDIQHIEQEEDIFSFDYDNLDGQVDPGVLGDERFSYGAINPVNDLLEGKGTDQEPFSFGALEDPTVLLERAKERVKQYKPKERAGTGGQETKEGESEGTLVPQEEGKKEGEKKEQGSEEKPLAKEEKGEEGALSPNKKQQDKKGDGVPSLQEGEKKGGQEGGAGGGENPAPEMAGTPEANIDDSSSKGFLDSLANGTPSNFMAGMGKANEVVPGIQGKEKEDLKTSLPEIEQPTGLETKAQRKQATDKKEGKELEKGEKPDIRTKAKDEPKEKPEEEHKQPGKQPAVDKVKAPKIAPRPEGEGANDEAWLQQAKSNMKSSLNALPTKDKSLKTDSGERPKIDTTGSADPQQNEENQVTSDSTMSEEKTRSDEASKQDFGENDIFPEIETEMLSPEVELKSPTPPSLKEVTFPEQIPADVLSAFDKEAKIKMDEGMAPQLQKHEAELSKKEAEDKKEREKTDKDIEQKTEEAKKEQEAEQKKAQDDVTKNREEWQAENQKIRDQYDEDVKKERLKADDDITKKIDETDKKVEGELSKAEKQAADEKKKVEAEAAAKKAEAKRKSEDSSWWDRVKDAVSSFFEGLKRALNTLFDGLRAFVKRVIEAAKKIATSLIDMARDFIIAAIKAFGEVLKALVNVALAAFPALAKRINALIDQAVNAATDLVNKLAEALKTAVCTLLDALGAVLDAILAAYQAMYNALLSALEFLVVGLMKILEGLANIALSLVYMVKTLKGAIVKEFIGEDVTSPLPNVETSEKELPILENLKAQMGGAGGGGSLAESSPPELDQQNTLGDKNTLDDSDFVLDPATPIEMDPELVNQLMEAMGGADTYELGGAKDPVETADLHENILGNSSDSTPSIDTDNSTGVPESGGSGAMDSEMAEWLAKSDAEKLQWNLDQMGQESGEPDPKKDGQKKASKAPADPASDAEIARKTGRLGVSQRLGFVGSQMVNGMQMWWGKNKGYVYAGLAGILVVAGVVAFFTGGAGLIGLLQLAVQAMTVYFLADAIMKIKGHLGDWLSKAWNGDPEGGGASLSKAIAIVCSEFLLEYVLKGVGKVFKRVRASMKATKGFQRMSRGAARVRKGVGNTVRRVTKPMRGVTSKGGKYVMKIKQGFGRGIKKLSDLRNKILDRLGFKRIWAEKAGRKLQMWGEFNSKVLLSETDADGNHKTRDITPEDRDFLKRTYGNKYEVGRKMEDGGIGVSDEFARQTRAGKAKHNHADLDEMDTADIRKEMGNIRPEFTKKAEFKKGADVDDIATTRTWTKRESRSIEESRRRRQEAIHKRDNPETYKGMDDAMKKAEYDKLNKKVIDQSEIIGEKAMDANMARHGAKIKHRGRGSRTVDRVYKKGGTYYVGEAKGGSSGLGGKQTVTDGVEGFSQQGTRPYLKKTIQDMRRSSDESTRRMGLKLQKAMKANKVRYMLGRQRIKPDGSLGDFNMKEFDLNAK